jgi:hypothetical protein
LLGQVFAVTRTNEVLRQRNTIELPVPHVSRLLADADAITLFTPGAAYRLSPVTGEIQAMLGIGSQVDDIAVADDAVWVADRSSGFIYRIPTID